MVVTEILVGCRRVAGRNLEMDIDFVDVACL